MKQGEIRNLLRNEFSPVKYMGDIDCYRTSVHLNDGTYLPCVIFVSKNNILNLIENRVKAKQSVKIVDHKTGKSYKEKWDYSFFLRSYMTNEKIIDIHSIASIEISPYSLPKKHYETVYEAGETAMSWVQFTAKMKDGKMYSFGTPYDFMFFNMPEGYTGSDIEQIYPHKKIDSNHFSPRFYFKCFID